MPAAARRHPARPSRDRRHASPHRPPGGGGTGRGLERSGRALPAGRGRPGLHPRRRAVLRHCVSGRHRRAPAGALPPRAVVRHLRPRGGPARGDRQPRRPVVRGRRRSGSGLPVCHRRGRAVRLPGHRPRRLLGLSAHRRWPDPGRPLRAAHRPGRPDRARRRLRLRHRPVLRRPALRLPALRLLRLPRVRQLPRMGSVPGLVHALPRGRPR